MNGLDLFSGIGGLSLALKPWVRTVAYCERDRYAQAVLLSRMLSGDLDRAPIWDDITSLSGAMLPRIDIIFGGFPCQDISVAGRGAGLAGERSGLFFEIMRLAQEIKPSFIFLENVPAIRTRGLTEVANSLAGASYDCRWDFVSAQEVGAPHIRQRWFCLAYANGAELRNEQGRGSRTSGQGAHESGHDGTTSSVANTAGIGSGTRASISEGPRQQDDFMRADWWEIEPKVGRVVDGFPGRVDCLSCLGNSVVPKQAQEAFMRLANITTNN